MKKNQVKTAKGLAALLLLMRRFRTDIQLRFFHRQCARVSTARTGIAGYHR
jgi:hypothetical protein